MYTNTFMMRIGRNTGVNPNSHTSQFLGDKAVISTRSYHHRHRQPVHHYRPRPSPCTAAAPQQSKSPSNRNNNGYESSSDSSSSGRGGGSSSSIGSGIKLENIAITFKNNPLLRDVTWSVQKGERAGLVGINGAGKTTQLQIITGALLPDSGDVIKSRPDMKIAYLNQEFDIVPTHTLREEFMSAFDSQTKVIKRQEEIQKELEDCGEDMDRMSALLDELNELSNISVDLDVNLIDKKIDKMMPELGFSTEDNDRLVASYSGGWQMRMCLGKILLQDPDLLLLDEPTNHLDVDAIQWLEDYLRKQEVPMVIVSHDRQFLDRLCTKIVETEMGKTTTYKGNYSDYVVEKEERTAQQWVAWEKQQKEIDRQSEMIQRLSAGARSGRASTAEKALEKLKAEDTFVEKPFVSKSRPFSFPPVERMGKVAVNIEELTHGYDGRTLFKDASLSVERGERVAIIGPNGAGKSTLLRLIMGTEEPQQGTAGLGGHGIVPNYFQQNQAEALDGNVSVLDTLVEAAPDAKMDEIKALLGKMGFSGTGFDKKVEWLSGGEKARLALAKFMLTKGTLLVLDEPTNHLDIPSKETLEEAVRTFEGAVIAVSHDRYFLKRIATRVVTVDDGQLIDYEGDYELFLEKNAAEALREGKKEADIKEVAKSQIKAKSKMSKAAKTVAKKEKAKAFNGGGGGSSGAATPKAAAKNAKRWK